MSDTTTTTTTNIARPFHSKKIETKKEGLSVAAYRIVKPVVIMLKVAIQYIHGTPII